MDTEGKTGTNRPSTVRAVFENSLVGIFTTTKDRNFSEVNKKAAGIFGFATEELIGRPTRLVFVSKESHTRFGEDIISALPEQEVLELQLQLKRKDGSFFLGEVSGSPLNGVDLEDGIVWRHLRCD